jgi:hypothetical protein
MSGEHDAPVAAFSELLGRRLVVCEKLDGVDASIAFVDGQLHVHGDQTRVHGDDGMQAWAEHHREALLAALGERWVVHGQWLQHKRVIFYDALPSRFVAFDAWDREHEVFVGAARRETLLAGTPIATAPVVHDGTVRSLKAFHALVGRSRFKTARWRETLRDAARELGLDPEAVSLATDPLDSAMGVIAAIERDEVVHDRIEVVRPTFGSAVLDAGDDPPISNVLARVAEP